MRMLLLLLIMLCTASASAQIYRWVDENGKVHYSDKKPQQDRSVETVAPQIKAPSEPDEGGLRRLEYLKSAEQIDAQREAEQRLAKSGRDKELADGISRRKAAENCDDARVQYGITFEEMAIYQTEWGDLRPMWVNDYYQGEREFISDQQRPALREAITEQLYLYCDDPTNEELLWETYDRWIDSAYCRVEKTSLERALDPQTRTPDTEVERIRNRINEYCY